MTQSIPPPSAGDDDTAPAASLAEQAIRGAPDGLITAREKQAIAIETSREEDA